MPGIAVEDDRDDGRDRDQRREHDGDAGGRARPPLRGSISGTIGRTAILAVPLMVYLVGVASPTQLATIVALDPIYVNFTVNEQDVLRIRAEARRKGLTAADLKQTPVEISLQTETGFPHAGKLDYVAPTVNQSTGTLAVRGIIPNADRVLLPGLFVRVRVPVDTQDNALLVPDTALGSDQSGRYLLVLTKENVVEQRKVTIGPTDNGLRVIDSGLKPDDRVVIAGLLRVIPGEKVDPQLQKFDQPQAAAR